MNVQVLSGAVCGHCPGQSGTNLKSELVTSLMHGGSNHMVIANALSGLAR